MFDGIPNGSPTFVTTGQKFGTGALQTKALAFYEINSGVISTSDSPFTVELWVNRSTAPATMQVVIGGSGYIGVNSSGCAIFNISSTTNTTINGTTAICDGAWHHIAAVYDGANITLYVDGKNDATGAVSGTNLDFNDGLWFIGALGADGNYSLDGALADEVVFWQSAKYTAAFTPPTSAYTGIEGMTALYHLDGNGNNSVGLPFIIAPNDPSIVYSPGNWIISAGSAVTINAGA
nr:LamG domain-containing protein [uncultured Acetobacter sp.]